MAPNLRSKNNLRYKLKIKAKHIEDLKLDIAQCVGWSPERRQVEKVNLALLQSQLYQWMSKLQATAPRVIVNPSISTPMTPASEEDYDTFDLAIGEGKNVRLWPAQRTLAYIGHIYGDKCYPT